MAIAAFIRMLFTSEKMSDQKNNVDVTDNILLEDEMLNFSFVVDKREGFGEDSEPLAVISKDNGAIGVFDGMGGSGATKYNVDGVERTGAYIASRFVKSVVEQFFLDRSQHGEDSIPSELKELLKTELSAKLASFGDETKSGLRSKMIRALPTTLSVCTYRRIEDRYIINSYWAGDSRNYLLTAEGLFQISKDDLDVDQDAMANLINDAALSNCVCADRDFHINNIRLNINKPFILISASDGCFGYLQSPMHFEFALLDTMLRTNSPQEWGETLKTYLRTVAGDDVSMSLVAIGFTSYGMIKEIFNNRHKYIFAEYIEELDELRSRQLKLKAQVEEIESILPPKRQEMWQLYKSQYESKLKENDE